jgi:hypothetical protein
MSRWMPRASTHIVTRRLATHNTSRGRHFAANLCAVLVSIFTFACSSRSAAASIVVQSSSHTHTHTYRMQWRTSGSSSGVILVWNTDTIEEGDCEPNINAQLYKCAIASRSVFIVFFVRFSVSGDQKHHMNIYKC